MVTLSEENYLKAIYHLAKQENASVSTNAIAQKMQTKASSVTDMIKKLSEKGLVNYQKYKGVHLTEKGRLAAVSVIRKHRLWEVFLVKKLNFSWDQVHEVAEQLEHIKSEKLTQQLDVFLEHPTKDPHGDPIPTKRGTMPSASSRTLLDCEAGDDVRIESVQDQGKEFLQFARKKKLTPGKKIEVVQNDRIADSMELKIQGEALLTLGSKTAEKIIVRS